MFSEPVASGMQSFENLSIRKAFKKTLSAGPDKYSHCHLPLFFDILDMGQSREGGGGG